MNTHNANEYLFLIRGTGWDAGLSPEEMQRTFQKIMDWFDTLEREGRIQGGRPLDDCGRLVSGGRGRPVADGPYVESKEAVGGYLIVLAKDMDDAVSVAETYPVLACGSSIEVRPILEQCPVFQRMQKELSLAPTH